MQEAFYKENAKVFRETECSIAPRFQPVSYTHLFHHTLVAQKAAYLVGREPTIMVKGEENSEYEEMCIRDRH